MNKNEIICVEQIPVITEQLNRIKQEVTEKVKIATSLVCTDETVKEVKKARAELSKDFKAWEEKRKEVKAVVIAPYERFEAVYKDCITNTYKNADSDLKRKIDSVEDELKAKKENEVKEYFEEYLLSKEIDFVTYENANINVTLSASLKSLKEQAKAFIDRVCDDLNLIDTQEHKAEILVEYKQSLNVSNAITTVSARLKAVEEEKARQEEIQRVTLTPPEPAPEKPITAPVEIDEKEYIVTFRVTGTKAKLRQLKEFLNKEGFKYE